MIEGDRDIVAFYKATHRCLIAEVEGKSSGQPEQKVYRAIGQILAAALPCQRRGRSAAGRI
jgi:hypothetical protein